MKRPWRRSTGKWTLRGLILLVAVVGLYITILAYPIPLFAHHARFEEFAVYSNEPLADDWSEIFDSVRARVEAMEYARPGKHCRVHLCNDRDRYRWFAFLTRRSPDTMGIGLSALGTIYLNETKIRDVAAGNTAGTRHSRFEGDLAECIAHEIAHFNMVGELGYRRAIGLPVWKSEGYAEYQANLASIRADPSYAFRARVALVQDDVFWSRSSTARELFRWHVLVEFLAEHRSMGLRELAQPDVSEAWAWAELLAWYRAES